jgi:hypothetical protein
MGRDMKEIENIIELEFGKKFKKKGLCVVDVKESDEKKKLKENYFYMEKIFSDGLIWGVNKKRS